MSRLGAIRGVLASAVILAAPFAFWTPLNDCFPLPKLLFLFMFGGGLALLGPTLLPAGGFAWLLPWSAWALLAALTGPGVTSPWRSLPEAALLALPAWAAVGAANAVPFRRAAAGFAAVSAALAAYGLAQASGWELGAWINPYHKGVSSTLGNPDLFGGFLVMPFALSLGAWLGTRRPAWAAASLLAGAGLVVTETRAAWLAALAVMAGLSAAEGRRPSPRLLAALALFAALGAGFLLARPQARAALLSRGALAERWWTWGIAGRALAERPLAGWGTGSFRTVYLRGQSAALRNGGAFHYTEYAHLEPLHLGVETGLLGLGLWCWGLACAFALWRSHPARKREPGLWRGLGAGWLGLAVDGLLSFPFHVPPSIVPAWVLLTLRGRPGEASSPSPVRAWAGAAVLLAAMTAALRLATASAALRDGQGKALAGDFAGARGGYRAALALVPGDVRIPWYAALTERQAGDPPAALALADLGLRLEPDWCELHHERGMALRAMNRPGEAEEAYRAAIRCNPDFASSWNNLGNLLGARGRLAEAAEAQRRALALDPGSPEARRNLAITLVRMGRRAEARALLEEAAP